MFILLTVASAAPEAYALQIPQGILPWLELVLPAAAVTCLAIALRRAFAQPRIYSGKILGSILGAVAVVLFAGSVWLFSSSRNVPRSASAPKAGQKAPDFTLKDTSGQTVSLAQMLATPIDSSTGKAPKAVLLVFYRGYW